MTLPHERTRAVFNTREFLLRLASPYGENAIKGVKKAVRQEALRLLRHYPFPHDGMTPFWNMETGESKQDDRHPPG
jgi:hypothetical protein